MGTAGRLVLHHLPALPVAAVARRVVPAVLWPLLLGQLPARPVRKVVEVGAAFLVYLLRLDLRGLARTVTAVDVLGQFVVTLVHLLVFAPVRLAVAPTAPGKTGKLEYRVYPP